ncbi:MAG: bis(5'-nucleosyl)-tetraphosphatase [Bacillota bacterium]
MKFEKSCGAVVFKKNANSNEYLIIKHKNGSHWGFPKGHVEENETEQETALREIWEEAGIKVRLLEDFRSTMEYSPKEDTIKEVVYFIGEAIDNEVKCQVEEIEDFKWLKYEDAMNSLTHSNSRELLKRVNNHLKNE